MRKDAQLAEIARAFQGTFGKSPEVTAFAPGRVNLLGEHTDYNGGYVLPMALRDLGVAIALGKGAAPGELVLRSVTLDATEHRTVNEGPTGAWSDYVLGCVQAVAATEVAATGMSLALMTSLPLGAGLSSSAALEVATLRAFSTLFALDLDPARLAAIAQTVENEFVGVPCGIMDQFASSVGKPGEALFLDTRTLEHAAAPGFPGHSFAVIASGVSHQLTDSGYAARVAECQEACAALEVETLSDLNPEHLPQINALHAPLNRRARHVVTDNRLTKEGLAAMRDGDAARFGRLMIESHASERDDFEITVPETDALAAAAVDAGALGARQTGGGWGGAVVALVPDDRAEAITDRLTTQFENARLLAMT